MSGLFEDVTGFNEAIYEWDTSQVTTMAKMFKGATSFNQWLQPWNVEKVRYMYGMFSGASAFSKSLTNWKVTELKNSNWMFANSGMNLWAKEQITGSDNWQALGGTITNDNMWTNYCTS